MTKRYNYSIAWQKNITKGISLKRYAPLWKVLAAHQGHDGWVITGYTPTRAAHDVNCHSCGSEQDEGNVLFKPVFERGTSPAAIQSIPSEEWVECPSCLETK